MRILVTGRRGQVARSLCERAKAGDFEVITLGRPELDLAGPAREIIPAVERARPEVIVSAAAYTQVDKAEDEAELAFAINESGAEAIARAAAGLGVPLIHISTDYVFDGRKDQPYVETDPTGPISVYGDSKLAGEVAVLSAHCDVAMLRTAWVYSPFGANFVKTMLRLGQTSENVRVVADQLGNPTSALDIADAILAIAVDLRGDSASEKRGVFHMATAGEASWADFAESIFRFSADAGGPSANVERISTADYPTSARRPANSRLDCSKLAEVYRLHLPEWRESLQPVVQRILRSEP